MTDGPLEDADLPELLAVAQACLDFDGGLPMLAGEPMLRSRLLRDRTLGIRESGQLVAAAGITVEGGKATASGMVPPVVRGRGLGTRLLRWTVAEAGDAELTVATESCSPGAERLYARHGLIRTFAEEVMRHDLVAVPAPPAPSDARIQPMTEASTADLFAAYVASFAERPGFVQPSPQEWLGDLESDDDWRRDLSTVVLDSDGVPVGFVNAVGHWIDQVGVVPAWRGRGLGAHLVSATLHALAAEGAASAWLTVNEDNPAAALYRNLGFTRYGIRARYVRPVSARAPAAPDTSRHSPGAP